MPHVRRAAHDPGAWARRAKLRVLVCAAAVVFDTPETRNRVGDLVFAHAFLTFISRSSMEIRVEVETEDRLTEARQKALTARFICFALDPNGKPSEVPSLLITTEEGKKYFEEGRKRHEGRKK